MKNILALAGSAALATLAVPALAQDTTQDTTCTAACAVDGDATVRQVVLGGEAVFAGFGGAVFEGEDGYAVVEKIGGADINITGNVAGGLCDDNPDCTSGDFTLSGNAFEQVDASAGAMSTTSGDAAIVENYGGAAARLNMVYGAFDMPVTTGSNSGSEPSGE